MFPTNTARKRQRASYGEAQGSSIVVVERNENDLLRYDTTRRRASSKKPNDRFRDMGRQTINISVGPEKERFVFDKASIAYHSDHFLQAIYGRSQTEFFLAEEEPAAFELFSRWMNTRNLILGQLHIHTWSAENTGVNITRLFLLAERYQIGDLMEFSYGHMVIYLLDYERSYPDLHMEHALRMWEVAGSSNIRKLPLYYLLGSGSPHVAKWLIGKLSMHAGLAEDVAHLTLFTTQEGFKRGPAWFQSFRGTKLKDYYGRIPNSI